MVSHQYLKSYIIQLFQKQINKIIMANSKTYIVSAPNQNVTSAILTNDYQAPVYAATINLYLPAYNTVVKVGQLTGALTINADVSTDTFGIGSKLEILFSADSAGAHVVTFGTGFASSGTLSVAASKFGKASFVFDGNEWIGSGLATA